jgi:hypothetical protein
MNADVAHVFEGPNTNEVITKLEETGRDQTRASAKRDQTFS